MTWSRTIGIMLFLLPFSTFAEDCRYAREIDERVDTSGFSAADFDTVSGDKVIRGSSGGEQARITGKVCASSEELLAQTTLKVDQRGQTLLITTDKPETGGGSWWRDQYAYVDFEAELPSRLAVSVRDRSGDVTISGVAGGLNVQDNSGDLEISDTAGEFHLRDNSGGILIRRHSGNVWIDDDNSGEIRIEDVEGSVQIDEDGSGDIEIHHVTQNVTIGKDGSGDIEVYDVNGDFRVDRDGSGDVDYAHIGGAIDIPKNKRH